MNPKVTRRRFIKGVVASGAAATTTGMWYAANGQDRPSGAVERLIRINVNGQMRSVDVAPQETLASTLRYKLGLTGTKLGCNRGECGACTVLVDDVATYACSVLTHSMKDTRIETVEGLESPNGDLHPVQQALLKSCLHSAATAHRDRSCRQLLYFVKIPTQRERKRDMPCPATFVAVALMTLISMASCAPYNHG